MPRLVARRRPSSRSPPSTAPRSAPACSSRSPATCASRRRRPGSACPPPSSASPSTTRPCNRWPCCSAAAKRGRCCWRRKRSHGQRAYDLGIVNRLGSLDGRAGVGRRNRRAGAADDRRRTSSRSTASKLTLADGDVVAAVQRAWASADLQEGRAAFAEKRRAELHRPVAMLAAADPSLFAAFGAGVISFISPCVLPLVPGYLSMMSGLSGAELAEVRGVEMRRVLRSTLLFVAGFTVVFVALGASATAVGRTLLDHQRGLNQIMGVIVIVMGLFLAGVASPRLLQAETSVPRLAAPARPVRRAGHGRGVRVRLDAVHWAGAVGVAHAGRVARHGGQGRGAAVRVLARARRAVRRERSRPGATPRHVRVGEAPLPRHQPRVRRAARRVRASCSSRTKLHADRESTWSTSSTTTASAGCLR